LVIAGIAIIDWCTGMLVYELIMAILAFMAILAIVSDIEAVR
jgi:hypothetical protein